MLADIYKGGDRSCDLMSEQMDSANDLWFQVVFYGAEWQKRLCLE